HCEPVSVDREQQRPSAFQTSQTRNQAQPRNRLQALSREAVTLPLRCHSLSCCDIAEHRFVPWKAPGCAGCKSGTQSASVFRAADYMLHADDRVRVSPVAESHQPSPAAVACEAAEACRRL